MKNSKFELKNFRVFDEKGAEFEMAPITIITGANSSGKSSVIKSLMLLNETLGKAVDGYIFNNVYNPFDMRLEFHKGKHNLGTYDKAKSNFSESDQIIFSYQKYSNLIMGDVKVNLYFGKDEEDFLKNGVLEKIIIHNIRYNKNFFDVDIDYENNELDIAMNIVDFKNLFASLLLTRRYYIDRIIKDLKHDANNIDYFMYYKSVDSVFDHFDNNDVNEYVKWYYNALESIIDVDGYGDIFKYDESLNYDNLTQLIYLPIDKIIDTDKNNIKESFNNLVLDKSKSGINLNNADITVCNSFIDAYIHSEYSDISKFISIFVDKFVGKHLSSINMNKISFMLSGMDRGEFNFIDVVRAQKTLIPEDGGDYMGSIVYDIMTVDEDVISEYMAKGGYKEVFSNIDDYDMFNSLFSVFFSLDSEAFNGRFGEVLPDALSCNFFLYYKPLEYELFLKFVASFLQECLINIPSYITDNTFVDAVRANVQRMYTYNNQGTDFNSLLLDYLTVTNGKNKSKQLYMLGTFMNKWIKEFDIADKILFEPTDDGLGIHIYIMKGEDKILLADEGYGITQLLSIMLQIELNIVKSPYSYSHQFVNKSEIRFKESTISIEEPEVNLHPKFQSKLAEMFIDAYQNYNVHFIIETHSEYLIRKLQAMVAKKDIKSDDVSINYIYNHDVNKRPEGTEQVIKINIEEDGRLDKPFGSGFFDEADNLAMDLLTLKFMN